ncbi:alpha/beta hydrolase [Amycolatopsis sp. NPDC004747]
MWGRITALVVLLVSVVAPPASASPGALDWVPGGVGAECTKIAVPLDWDRPDGPKTTLAFDRHRGGSARWRGAPLQRQAARPGPVRSGAIDCRLPVHDPDVTAFPRSAAEADALIRHNQAVEAGCAGPPAGHLDAVTQARDLDAVRAALGEERASFFFYGYTGPGQAYAHLFPHRVRAMAMDSPLEHSVPVVVRAAAYASTVEREFTRFVAWCTGSVRCALHGQDVAAVYDTLLRDADRRPVRLDLPPEPGRPEPQQTTVAVRGDDLAFLTGQLLEIGDLTLPGGGMGWADLATAVQQAAGGTSPVFAFVYRYSWGFRDLWNPLRAGMCQDYPASVTDLVVARPIVAALAPHTRGASRAWDALSGCAGRRTAGTNPPRPAIVRGAPPILVVGAEGNPWSPYENVVRVSAEIRGSVLLTYAGHPHPLADGGLEVRAHRRARRPRRHPPAAAATLFGAHDPWELDLLRNRAGPGSPSPRR